MGNIDCKAAGEPVPEIEQARKRAGSRNQLPIRKAYEVDLVERRGAGIVISDREQLGRRQEGKSAVKARAQF